MDIVTIFQIQDADTSLKATASTIDGTHMISIINPDHATVISMTLADFRRLVTAVDRHF